MAKLAIDRGLAPAINCSRHDSKKHSATKSNSI